MYLLDTNVISESAPPRTPGQASLGDWLEAHNEVLFLSCVTVVEIEGGIARAVHRGAGRKAARLDEWLASLLHLYASRILPLDISIARLAGRLSARARMRGAAPGFADVAIAATAAQFGYTVLTRNLRHFSTLGVPAHDPFASLPDVPRGNPEQST